MNSDRASDEVLRLWDPRRACLLPLFLVDLSHRYRASGVQTTQKQPGNEQHKVKSERAVLFVRQAGVRSLWMQPLKAYRRWRHRPRRPTTTSDRASLL